MLCFKIRLIVDTVEHSVKGEFMALPFRGFCVTRWIYFDLLTLNKQRKVDARYLTTLNIVTN